jgi:replicative DNA helicase
MNHELPHAPESEAMILGVLMQRPDLFDEIAPVVRGSMFMPRHQIILAELTAAHAAGSPVDLTLIHQRLIDAGKLKQAGGLEYLIELVEVAFPPTVAEHVRSVRDCHHRRRIIEAANDIAARAYASPDAQAQQQQAEQAIFALSTSAEQNGMVRVADAITQVIAATEQRALGQEKNNSLSTGFPDLDANLRCLIPGSLIVIAGETSMGKSALAANIAANMAYSGVGSLYFSLEMSPAELGERILSARSGVEHHAIHAAKNMGPDDWAALEQTAADSAKTPLWIADTPGLDLAAMASMSRLAVARLGVKCIFIDYLQIMDYPDPSNETNSIRQITGATKKLARQLGVPIVLVSQLHRRGASETDDREPKLKDLHGSSSVEKDANAVLMVHRREYYHQTDRVWRDANPDEIGRAHVIIAKQRNGPVGRIPLVWDASRTCFRAAAKERQRYGDE